MKSIGGRLMLSGGVGNLRRLRGTSVCAFTVISCYVFKLF